MRTELSPEDLLMVESIYRKTGILTVKDRQTAKFVEKPGQPLPWQDMKPYGERYHPIVNEETKARNPDVQHVRVVIRELEATENFPKGVPIGGVEMFSRRSPLSLPYGEKDFQSIGFKRDISRAEFDRLKAFATNGVFFTDEMRKKAEKEAIARTQGLSETQRDPVGKMADVLAEALKKLATQPAATTVTAPPPPPGIPKATLPTR